MSILDTPLTGLNLDECLERLQPDDLDELVLAATEAAQTDRQARAQALLAILHWRRDPRYQHVRLAWFDIITASAQDRRAQPPVVVESPAVLRAALPIEHETRLRVSDGRALVISRGNVACDVSLTVVPCEEAQLDGSDRLELTLRLTDDEGRCYRAVRHLRAGMLVNEAVATHWLGLRETDQCVSRGVRFFADNRANLSALAYVDRMALPFAYRVKYLYGACDLYRRTHGVDTLPDQLIVRIRSGHLGALPEGPTPPASFAISHLASLVAFPALSATWPSLEEPVVFDPGDDSGDAEPLVRCLSAR